ncbi:MAG: hypothetical protein Q7N87_05445 [Candidatus Uhrbacteria bacterium]|nr:hypothetical protein [Candidatus Uhrbacteria bacterium]
MKRAKKKEGGRLRKSELRQPRLEEQVMRMRFGASLRDDDPIEAITTRHSKTMKVVQSLEARALRHGFKRPHGH